MTEKPSEPQSGIATIADALGQLYRLMVETIVPNLKAIQENQIEQRQQSDWITHNLEEFRLEMQQRFAELHAELASTRTQLEDAMVVLREQRAAESNGKKILIH
jgi:hypothetical protein